MEVAAGRVSVSVSPGREGECECVCVGPAAADACTAPWQGRGSGEGPGEVVPLRAGEAAHPRGPSSKSIEIGPHLMGPTDAPPRSTSSAAGAVALSSELAAS